MLTSKKGRERKTKKEERMKWEWAMFVWCGVGDQWQWL